MEKMTIMKNYNCQAEEGLSYVAIRSGKRKIQSKWKKVVVHIMVSVADVGIAYVLWRLSANI